MARKTKEDVQKTKDDILSAAERVFLEKGVGNTTMADIAAAASVSRGAIYGHYANKIDVCLAMCDRIFTTNPLPIVDPERSALAQLYDFGARYIQAFCPPPNTNTNDPIQHVCEILYEKCERTDENEPLIRLREQKEEKFLTVTKDLLKLAIAHGELNPSIDLTRANLYFHATLEGIRSIQVWVGRVHPEFWQIAENLLKVCIDALRTSKTLCYN